MGVTTHPAPPHQSPGNAQPACHPPPRPISTCHPPCLPTKSQQWLPFHDEAKTMQLAPVSWDAAAQKFFFCKSMCTTWKSFADQIFANSYPHPHQGSQGQMGWVGHPSSPGGDTPLLYSGAVRVTSFRLGKKMPGRKKLSPKLAKNCLLGPVWANIIKVPKLLAQSGRNLRFGGGLDPLPGVGWGTHHHPENTLLSKLRQLANPGA